MSLEELSQFSAAEPLGQCATAILVCANDTRVRYANTAALELLGVPAHALFGGHLTEFLPALQEPLDRCLLGHGTVGGQGLELAPMGQRTRRLAFTLTALWTSAAMLMHWWSFLPRHTVKPSRASPSGASKWLPYESSCVDWPTSCATPDT